MTASDVSLVRLYIDDPAGQSQRFETTLIQQLIDSTGDVHAAAAELWAMKAATVSLWYLSQTDGALLDREKVFRHCMDMSDYHRQVSGASIISVEMSTMDDEDASAEF